jgi:hypothetical protein
VAGAPYVNTNRGAVYVRTRGSAADWSDATEVKLAASDGASNSYFGWDVAISADGKVIVVGAYTAAIAIGKAYIYTQPAKGGWSTSAAEVKLTGTSGRYFGTSVDVSADGKYVVVSATLGGALQAGEAYVFTRPASGGWSTSAAKATLAASNGASNANFGYSVGISGDGKVVAVGAPYSNSNTGSVYV